MPFTDLVMQPAELEVVQSVYKQIVFEPWFDRSPGNDKQFAGIVLRIFSTGTQTRDELLSQARVVALDLFVRGNRCR